MGHRSCAFLAMLAASVISSPSTGQTLNSDPSGKEMREAVSQTSERARSAFEEVAAETYPIFVFIPGIFGSKLTKIMPDGQRRLIWGKHWSLLFTRPNPLFAYSEDDQVDAEVLDSFDLGGGALDVYGKAIQKIKRKSFQGESVWLFAYDWRQSNERSAVKLNSWMCDRIEKLQRRPVIFIAHSMGGLVLKRWLQKYHQNAQSLCGSTKLSEAVKVDRVIFLGTPHLGTPKAVYAFGEQHLLFTDPSTSGIILQTIDANTIAGGLNAFGATFPSGYQLLPAPRTRTCGASRIIPTSVWFRDDDELHARIDLFHLDTWKRFGWPRSLSSSINRSRFMNDTLPGLLDEARRFVCELREFEVDEHYRVVRFFGDRNDTPCKIEISSEVEGTSSIRQENCPTKGDGTVPRWSAEEDESTDIDRRRPAHAEHTAIPASEQFILYLGSIYREIEVRALKKALKKGDRAELMRAFGSRKTAIVFPPARDLEKNAEGTAVDPDLREINRAIINVAGVELRHLRKGAQLPKGSLSQAEAIALYADLADENDPSRAFALNEAANIYLARGFNTAARTLGEQSFQIAELLPPERAKLARRGAALVVGVAAGRQGLADESGKYLTLAAKGGSRIAQQQLALLYPGMGNAVGAQKGGGARPPAFGPTPFGFGPLPSGMPPLTEARFRNDEVVLQLGGRLSQDELASLLRQLRLEVVYQESVGLLGRTVLRLKLPGGATVRSVIAALEKKGAQFSAQPSYQYDLVQDLAQLGPADTSRKGDSAQYIVEKLGLVEAHLIATGKNIKVAVIDSEIDVKHPDLEGVVAGTYDALPSDDLTPHPHGTGMAGAIASHKRLLGVAPGAQLLAVRAFGVNTGSAQGTSLNIVKGLQWAVDQGAKVINMSFAGPRDPILQQAMKRLTDQGIILIAAAGNAGPKSPPLYPGADPSVIAVSATDLDDKTYKNANRGKYVAIAAPGVDILVPAPEGGYQLTTGTSVAAAHISGVVALMLERNSALTPNEVRAILATTARKLPQDRNEVGAGLVDPINALARSGPKRATLH